MTVSLQDHPEIASISKTFQVTIDCTVTTISFNPGITTSQIVNIGIDEPFSIPFGVTKTLACIAAPTISLTPSLGFVTIS